jgi:tight adherence protein B
VTPEPGILAQAVTAFLAVGLTTLSLALFWEWSQERAREHSVQSQLRKIQRLGPRRDENVLLRVIPPRVAGPLLKLAMRIPGMPAVEAGLREAGMSWSLGTFLLVSMGCAIGFGLVTSIIFNFWFATLIAEAVGAVLPWLYVRRRRTQRLYAFEEGLPDALDLLGRAVRAGHPIGAGIKIVADEALEPVAGEFLRTFEEQRFGLPFEDTMLALATRVPLVDLRMLVTAVLIQREVGGNLAEVLDNLADVIRQRFTIRRQLRVHTAQGRMSGYILAALPIVVGSIIMMINPEYVRLLFNNELGRMMVMVGASMQVIGFLWIRHIVNIEI